MNKEELFISIYNNDINNKKIVEDVIGESNLMVDDIISECVMIINKRIDEGTINIEDITIGDNINYSFWKRVLVNKSIDYVRYTKRKNNTEYTIYKEEYILDDYKDMLLPDDLHKWDIYDVHPIDFIKQKLDEFSKLSNSNRFHSKIYEYYYLKNIPILKLSKETKISRKVLSSSKKYMESIVRKWVTDEYEKPID